MRFLVLALAPVSVIGQTLAVATYHNDNARSGWYSQEPILTPANVNFQSFGKLGAFPVDGEVYAQPLYVPGVEIPRKGRRNVVYVATEHDSLYAFDADLKLGGQAEVLWRVSLTSKTDETTPVPYADVGADNIYPEVGITGTPAIDVSTNTIYVVGKLKATAADGTPSYEHVLAAYDTRTGRSKFGWSVRIQAQTDGTCEPNDGQGHVLFSDKTELQRSGLLLANGNVYVAFASHGDIDPFSGWILAYDAKNVQHQVAAFNAVPNNLGGQHPCRGGIWQGGAGLSTDADGNLFVATGNGEFNANQMGNDYGDSLLKMDPQLNVLDWFAPYDQGILQQGDIDLGAGGALVLPDGPPPYAHLTVIGGKEGTIYLVNRDLLGGFNESAQNSNVIQTIPGGSGGQRGVFGMPAYFNGLLYFGGLGDPIKAYSLSSGALTSSPVQTTATTFGFLGTDPVVSSSGSVNGIVWAVEIDAATYSSTVSSPAILHAYDAGNLLIELYNSSQAGARDSAGPALQFAVPTVANGRVYVGTRSEVSVYGLFN